MREKQRKAEMKKLGITDDQEEEVQDDELPDSKKGWKCLFTGNIMFSDGYKMKPIFEDKVMEVKA